MKELIIPFINFAVFAALIVYFTRKKVSELFMNREKALREEFDGYKGRYESATKEIEKLKEKLDSIESEKNAVVAQYEKKSEALYREIINAAKSESSEMQIECGRILDTELDEMKNKIVSEFTDSIMKAVEERTAALPESEKKKLKEDFIKLLSREK